MTRTYAILKVSEPTFKEIMEKLNDTGGVYSHAFVNFTPGDGFASGKARIDMDGLALELEEKPRKTKAIQTGERVRKIITDNLNVSESQCVLTANLQDNLGADALELIEIIMGIENDFGITIPDSEAEKILTVGDIIKYVEANT